jgi:hypothetical protein
MMKRETFAIATSYVPVKRRATQIRLDGEYQPRAVAA